MQPRLAQYCCRVRMRSWNVTNASKVGAIGRAGSRTVGCAPPRSQTRTWRFQRSLGGEERPHLIEELPARQPSSQEMLDEARQRLPRLASGGGRERLVPGGSQPARLEPEERRDRPGGQRGEPTPSRRFARRAE